MVQGSFCTTGCEFTRLLAILQQLSLSAVRLHFQNGLRYPHEDGEQEDIVGCLHALGFTPWPNYYSQGSHWPQVKVCEISAANSRTISHGL